MSLDFEAIFLNIFNEDFKNVSLLWLRLEHRARTSRKTLVELGSPRVFQKVSNNCNFASGHARHLILVSNPMFLGMANHLGPFS